MLSLPDLPIWVRGTAALLFLFASWWLVSTPPILELLGWSTAPLSLGLIAVFILRGMHQPLDLWPPRHRRARFSLWWALLPPGVVALMLVAAGLAEPVSGQLRALMAHDTGVVLLVLFGAAVWSLSLGRVRQSGYRRWYGLAVGCAVLPFLAGRLDPPAAGAAAPGAGVGLAALLVWLPVDVTRVLIAEEFAFRRVLVGRPERAGVAVVLGAALVSALWIPAVHHGMPLLDVRVANALLSALVSGFLYVLSGSLLVAAIYHGTYLAVLTALGVGSDPGATTVYAPSVSSWVLVATAVIAGLLAIMVSRRQGWVGEVRVEAESHATGD